MSTVDPNGTLTGFGAGTIFACPSATTGRRRNSKINFFMHHMHASWRSGSSKSESLAPGGYYTAAQAESSRLNPPTPRSPETPRGKRCPVADAVNLHDSPTKPRVRWMTPTWRVTSMSSCFASVTAAGRLPGARTRGRRGGAPRYAAPDRLEVAQALLRIPLAGSRRTPGRPFGSCRRGRRSRRSAACSGRSHPRHRRERAGCI
jgi:hypothetical protein